MHAKSHEENVIGHTYAVFENTNNKSLFFSISKEVHFARKPTPDT